MTYASTVARWLAVGLAVGLLLATLEVLTVVAAVRSDRAPAAPSADRGEPPRGVLQAPFPQANAQLKWPLPRSCARTATGGRAVREADRREIGPAGVVVATYQVRRRALTKIGGKGSSCHDRLWDAVRHVAPARNLAMVRRFVVFEPPPDARRDQGVIVGFVRPRDGGNRTWTLGLTMRGLDSEQVAEALVHEVGHLLSLEPAQVDTRQRGTCRTFATKTGCSRPGSLLDDFVERSWRGILDDWSKANDRRGAARTRALRALYRAHPDTFVSEYAATHPDEDFAETFAAWCLSPSPRSGPFTTPALRAKARWLDGRPEVRGMRARCTALRQGT